MQTGGHVLLFLIVPIVSEGCCVNNYRTRRRVLQQSSTQLYYRAVEGEVFMLPCSNRKSTWFRIGERPGGREDFSFECETKFLTEVQHTGNYTEQNGELFLYLQVVSQASLPCWEPARESHVRLRLNIGEKIFCPGFNCSDNSQVTWYKESKPVSKQQRDSCSKNGFLTLCTVSEHDTGVFFCDRSVIDREVHWIYRRSVNVTVISQYRASEPPHIVYGKTTEDVEIGSSHSLVCLVHFPFEVDFAPEVHWSMNLGGNKENHVQLHGDKPQQELLEIDRYQVTATAVIDAVTTQHLNNTYTCVASNKAGSSNVTISLRRKITEKYPSLVGYPIAFLMAVTVLGVVFRRNWLELQLILRSHCQYGKRHRDKEFDVFLSYVSSPPSAEFKTDLADTELKEPVEFVLSRMLEDRWGYRLCMMERDLLPGGVYRDDVVSAIQRSQAVVCVLSTDYLSNTNALFVLESGVQALLQASIRNLLLIQTSHTSTTVTQVDSALVHRALKVLPSLVWTSGETSSSFWKSLRRTLPPNRVDVASHKQGLMKTEKL